MATLAVLSRPAESAVTALLKLPTYFLPARTRPAERVWVAIASTAAAG
jgi:hypothetical protein